MGIALLGLKLANEHLPDLLAPKPPGEGAILETSTHSVVSQQVPGGLTEEEERELDELLNDDDQ